MPRVPVHTLDDAPEQTRPTLEEQSRKVGNLLNIHDVGTELDVPAAPNLPA